ncbi:MAG TPA: hypothetical protein VES20_05490, partial [Bryobacteraceae bacterium]|nr:hypothetical protein [Bryobacteraceae bacterium]
MFGRLKNLLGGGAPASRPAALSGASNSPTGEPRVRSSNGLEEFFASLQDRSGLTILDWAGASQDNVSFITSMGHRLSSEDFVR